MPLLPSEVLSRLIATLGPEVVSQDPADLAE